MSNLVDNALKFGREVEVELAREDRGQIAVSIKHRGPGIPPDKLKSVLQPFVRLETSRSRDTGGSGLGLAIASQLAGALNGADCRTATAAGCRRNCSFPRTARAEFAAPSCRIFRVAFATPLRIDKEMKGKVGF